MAASLEVDQAQINRLLLDLVAIGERHGIRFPRECSFPLKNWSTCNKLGCMQVDSTSHMANVFWLVPGMGPCRQLLHTAQYGTVLEGVRTQHADTPGVGGGLVCLSSCCCTH